MDFHLRLTPDLTVEEGHRIYHEVKVDVLLLHPYLRDVLIHIEPANRNGNSIYQEP